MQWRPIDPNDDDPGAQRDAALAADAAATSEPGPLAGSSRDRSEAALDLSAAPPMWRRKIEEDGYMVGTSL